MPDRLALQTALLSVSDKTDLAAFARRLVRHQVRIISTGGTARLLNEAGVDATPVESITGFPEMMDGRVKTLHPKIHGALLALRHDAEHARALTEHGIAPIDLVCVNLYPFEQTVAAVEAGEASGATAQGTRNAGDAEVEKIIEQIDIGGPAMIRSAAKNHRYVACVTDPSQYDAIGNEVDANEGATTLALRQSLAAAAFARTAAYDAAISAWMARRWTNLTRTAKS